MNSAARVQLRTSSAAAQVAWSVKQRMGLPSEHLAPNSGAKSQQCAFAVGLQLLRAVFTVIVAALQIIWSGDGFPYYGRESDEEQDVGRHPTATGLSCNAGMVRTVVMMNAATIGSGLAHTAKQLVRTTRHQTDFPAQRGRYVARASSGHR